MLYKLLKCVIVAVSLVQVESRTFGDHVCQTHECEILAKKIKKSMNTNVEPCDNFYEYACGKWTAEKSVPSPYYWWDQYAMIDQTVRSRVKGLLEIWSEQMEIWPIKQARRYYRQCMDEKSIEASGIEPIHWILGVIGGWPMAMKEKDWSETKFPWKKVNRYFLQKTGGYYFWNIQANYAVGNDTLGGLTLSDQVFPMAQTFPRSGIDTTSPSWEKYRRLISDVVKMFTKRNGVPIDEARLLKETNELISFEMELHAMSVRQKTPDVYEEMNIVGKNISKKDADAPNSTFDYEIIIDDLFDTAGVKTSVNQLSAIRTDNQFYVDSLPEYLQSVSQRIIVNYLHWRFIEQTWRFLNKEISDTILNYFSEPPGMTVRNPRDTECVEAVYTNMIHVVSYLYVQQYFTENIEKSAKEMIQNIRSTFVDKIQNSQWLGEKPKGLAKGLLNDMNIFIAFPDWYKNASALKEYYKGFHGTGTYFHTTLTFMKSSARRNIRNFLTQETTFDGAVNYGMAGCTVGHEIMHAFTGDDMCSWTKADLISLSTSEVKTILDRAACFINQSDTYSGYPTLEAELMWPCGDLDGDDPYAGYKTIGQRTEAENIADTTGVQSALLAFKKKAENIYPQLVKKLPDLDFTDDQLFFLSYANFYCTAINSGYENIFDGGEHSKPDFRVNAVVSNTVGFAEAFNCPAGKPMNPEKKCTIWDQPESI